MNFASSVAVAVAPGTPGIGNVTTGLPPSHTTDVLPAVATSAGTCVPGRTEKSGGSWIPASADLSAPCGPAHRRIIRSRVAAAMGVAFPLPLRSEEHTSELQSQSNLVCRLLLEKKKKN